MQEDFVYAARCLPSFYDSALKSDDLPVTLDILAELTGARGVMLYAHDRGVVEYQQDLSSSVYRGKQHLIEDHMQRFGHYEMQAMTRMAQSLPGEFQTEENAYQLPIETLEKREDFVSARHHMGIFRRVGFRFDSGPHLHSGAILQFPAHLREVPQAALDMAGFMMPHLSKVVELNRFYSLLRARYNAVLSVLDRMAVGICVTTPNAAVIVANAAAQAILDEGRTLRQDARNRLACANDKMTDSLNAAITTVSDTANGEASATGFELPLPGPDADTGGMLVVVAPLRDANGELERGLFGALVMLIDTSTGFRMNMDPFATLNGLTQAEAEIAALLVSGHIINEIAERRNVVPETIRSQIKSIYTKSGVRNRAAFMWKAVQYSPPIT